MNDKLLRQVIGAVVLLLALAIVIRWFNSQTPATTQPADIISQQTQDDSEVREYQVAGAQTPADSPDAQAPASEPAKPAETNAADADAAVAEQGTEPATEAKADTRAVLAPGYSAAADTKDSAVNPDKTDTAASEPTHSAQATPSPIAAKAAPAAAAGDYLVQVASVTDKAAAQGLVKRLAAKGYPAHMVAAQVHGKTTHRVQVGPYTKSVAQAQADALKQLLGHGVLLVSK